MNQNLKYCVDGLGKGWENFLEHTKITFIKFKLLLFSSYALYFAYSYCFKFKSTKDGNLDWSFEPVNAPPSSIIFTGIIIVFLVIADIIEIQSKRKGLIRLISDNSIPLSIKEQLIKKL